MDSSRIRPVIPPQIFTRISFGIPVEIPLEIPAWILSVLPAWIPVRVLPVISP